MKYHVIINSVKSVDELKDAWSNTDYMELLSRFGFEDGKESKPEDLLELLFMAISDFDPEEAAQIILEYRLSDYLNVNQMEQIAHEMLQDKISEEYADITLHHQLYSINQLLHKAYNGTFPNAKATLIEFEITPNKEISKENVVKAFSETLANSNIIKRLYANQLAGKEAFDEAESIIWDLTSKGENSYLLTTSDYWMNKEDFSKAEFDVSIVAFDDENDQ
ncbi:MAG: hypothetical protein ABI295_02675 [Xanthomarina sp.]